MSRIGNAEQLMGKQGRDVEGLEGEGEAVMDVTKNSSQPLAQTTHYSRATQSVLLPTMSIAASTVQKTRSVALRPVHAF